MSIAGVLDSRNAFAHSCQGQHGQSSSCQAPKLTLPCTPSEASQIGESCTLILTTPRKRTIIYEPAPGLLFKSQACAIPAFAAVVSRKVLSQKTGLQYSWWLASSASVFLRSRLRGTCSPCFPFGWADLRVQACSLAFVSQPTFQRWVWEHHPLHQVWLKSMLAFVMWTFLVSGRKPWVLSFHSTSLLPSALMASLEGPCLACSQLLLLAWVRVLLSVWELASVQLVLMAGFCRLFAASVSRQLACFGPDSAEWVAQVLACFQPFPSPSMLPGR
jgi:hypothetical protein